MKTILKYTLITLFCISTIKSACTTGTIAEGQCDATSCKWTETVPASCGGTGTDTNTVCSEKSISDCAAAGCTLTPATGTCAEKTCADYNSESTCKAVETCQWSNNACTIKSATGDKTCDDYTTESTCKAVDTCQWSNNACTTKSATGDKTCADYTTESTCKAVTTCQWSNNACTTKSATTTTTTTDDDEDDGVFGLKSSYFIFLIFFLF